MNIVIVDNQARESILKSRMLPWAMKKNAQRRAKIIVGVLCVILVAVSIYESTWTASENGVVTYRSPKRDKSYQYELGLLSALVIGGFVMINRSNTLKNKFIREAARFAPIAYENSNTSTTTFTDAGYRFESPLITTEFKWKIFYAYSYFGDYLILHADPINWWRVHFDKSKFDPAQWSDFNGFVMRTFRPLEKSRG